MEGLSGHGRRTVLVLDNKSKGVLIADMPRYRFDLYRIQSHDEYQLLRIEELLRRVLRLPMELVDKILRVYNTRVLYTNIWEYYTQHVRKALAWLETTMAVYRGWAGTERMRLANIQRRY